MRATGSSEAIAIASAVSLITRSKLHLCAARGGGNGTEVRYACRHGVATSVTPPALRSRNYFHAPLMIGKLLAPSFLVDLDAGEGGELV